MESRGIGSGDFDCDIRNHWHCAKGVPGQQSITAHKCFICQQYRLTNWDNKIRVANRPSDGKHAESR